MEFKRKIMPSFRKNHRQSIKRRWILSCISLTLIPIFIGIFIFFTNINNFKRQTIQNNEVLLLQIQSLMDQEFYDVKSIVQKLSTEPSLNAFSLFSKNSDNTLLKRQLKEKLSQYRGYSTYIQDIYICFWDTDEFVSDKTAAPSRIFYYTYHNNARLSYEEWVALLRRTHVDETVVLPMGENKTSLAYVKALPLFSEANINATIVVLIDNENISAMARSVGQKTSCEMNLLLRNGSPVLPLSSILSAGAEKFPAFDRHGGVINRTAAEGGVVLSSLPSTTFDITYILGTPRSAYYHELRHVNLLFIAGLFIVILGSICFTAWFICKNYAPIKEIMDIVRCPEVSGQPGSSTDEYSVIKNAIVSSKNASDEMQNKLNRQGKTLFNTMLTLLMFNSSFAPGGTGREDLARLKSYFALEYFSVLLLSLDKQKAPETGIPFSEEEALRLSSFLQETPLLQKSNSIFWVIEMNDRFILLFNMDENCSSQWTDFVQDVETELTAWWHQTFKKKLLITASRCSRGLESISHAYEEAEYSMKYRLVFGTSFQSQNRNDALPSLSGSYFYPPEEETKLFNVIASGDAEKARETFNNLWRINLEKKPFTSGFLYCLLFDIMGTVIRACNLITPVSSINSNLIGTVEKLIVESNLDEMRKYILGFICDVCHVYSDEHSKSTDTLKNNILEYIDSHYDDPNMSVEYIGEVFGKSRAYLFSLFKEDTGFSLLYHINKVRVEHAKKFLRGSTRSVQNIASLVGFNSSISLTRTFKKYESITPSQYRELNPNNKG